MSRVLSQILFWKCGNYSFKYSYECEGPSLLSCAGGLPRVPRQVSLHHKSFTEHKAEYSMDRTFMKTETLLKTLKMMVSWPISYSLRLPFGHLAWKTPFWCLRNIKATGVGKQKQKQSIVTRIWISSGHKESMEI